MQIKDLRQFRTDWKKEQGYDIASWDEHFIGSVHGKNSGFYKMVNGIVGDIKADLTPKLQNAQDEQAIYEFLQNAADCGATECAVIYDEKYFMVINNGKPFSKKDMKALLNTFQGTKADKSNPENFSKIGRYGVGFKLAYRLLGKSDGVRELYEDLAGPVIFSWHKAAQFSELMKNKQVLSLKTKNSDTAPWLMKIILACFPATPDESVKGLDYQERIVFDSTEVKELKDFLNRHAKLLENLSLKQGSLFFLKFGPKKNQKLRTSLENLKSGIGYSLNTLKTLEKVVLQDKVIEEHPVTFENFTIQPGTEAFRRIDPEFNFAPIELSVGIPNTVEQAYALKNAPNLYQFFPMRNEKHQLGFFIHGTSFAKITDRTRLDNQGEANKETLKYLAAALISRMNEYQMDNPQRFANIYRSILVSERSFYSNDSIVAKYLLNPLLEYIKVNIPTDKQNFYTKDLVILKNTTLPITPMTLGIGKEWFYWANSEALNKEASNRSKLGLKKWGLKELIAEGNSSLVNNWLQKLNVDKYKMFTKELKSIRFDSKLMVKFNGLKCFKFTDNNFKSQFYSLDDLKNDPNAFVLNDKTKSIKAELKALGFAVLEFNIESYESIYSYLKSELKYLVDNKLLFEKIAERTSTKALAMCHKQGLFKVLQPLVPKHKFVELKLFRNQKDVIVPLKSLIAPSAVIPDWFEPFKIHQEEDWEALKPYYIKQDQGNLYIDIVHPYWESLTSNIYAITDFYKSTKELYLAKKFQKPLSKKPYFFINEAVGFVGIDQVFYHPQLAKADNYEALFEGVYKLMGLYIPEKSILPYLSAEPFKTAMLPNGKAWKTLSETFNQKIPTIDLYPFEKVELFKLLGEAMSPNDFNRLALFTNKALELMPIRKLLPMREDLPTWLFKYQINEKEYDSVLDAFFTADENIYSQIIFNYWKSIITDKSILKDINGFYKYVTASFQFSKFARPLNINNQNYIYINEEVGFVGANQVFYNPALTEVVNKEALSNAIFLLTGLYVPHAKALPFLGEAPLKTKATTIRSSLKKLEATLNYDEVYNLFHYMEVTGEDFCMLLYAESTDSPTEYLVSKKGKQTIYYIESNKPQILEAIQTVFGKNYKRLPQSLYNPDYRNKGLLFGKALLDKLSRSTNPDILSAIAEESDNLAVQEQMIGKLERIAIKVGEQYKQHSLEHKALQVFLNQGKDAQTIRKKIIITDSKNNIYKLSDIGFSPIVTFESKGEGTHQLELADILPKFRDLQNLLTTITTQFPDFEENVLKEKVFESTEKSKLSIFTELNKQFKTVENAAQLAFLVLFATTNKNNLKLRDFYVKTGAGTTKLSSYTVFHLKGMSFIQPNAILDMASYQGIGALLGITNKKPAFVFNNQRIAIAPYFDKNTFICSPLVRATVTKQDELGTKVLDFMFKHWKSNPIEEIELFTELPQQMLYDFQPSKCFYPQDFARSNEALPTWVDAWIGKNTNKVQFLTALGVNTDAKASVKIRQYFKKNDTTINSKIIDTLNKESNKSIASLLDWLKLNEATFSSTDERIEWLRKLYQKIGKVDSSTPLPYIYSVDGNEIIYRLGDFRNQRLYLVEKTKRAKLLERYQITIGQLFNLLQKADKKLTDIPVKDVNLVTTDLEVVLDIETLEKYAVEWSSPYYLKWKKNVNHKIYIYDGEMPFKIHYLHTVIDEFQKGDAVIYRNRAYINSDCDNVEEALFEVSTSSFNDKQILQLLRHKNEGLSMPVASAGKLNTANTPQQTVLTDTDLENVETLKKEGHLEFSINLSELPENTFDTLKELLKYAENSRIRKV